MKQYLDALSFILTQQNLRPNRTGVNTYSVFNLPLTFDLRDGFPLVTTKEVHFKSIIHELLWFLKGDTNIKYLNDNGVTIWDEWADENGDLGPVYGSQWRSFPTPDGSYVDQIAELVGSLTDDPYGRRHIVTAWNPGELDQMALPPCHMFFQCYVENCPENGEPLYLSMTMYQRSADMFLGVPFNIASYALLLSLLAQRTYYIPKTLNIVLGDAHIYENHVDQCLTQIGRLPYPLPRLTIDPFDELENVTYEHIHLADYKYHPKLSGKVAV